MLNVGAPEHSCLMQKDSTDLASKRIIIVLPGFSLDGAERQALLLARYLHHEKHAQVQVWGLNVPGHATELCEEYGLPWRIVRISWRPDRVLRLKSLVRFGQTLRQTQPDIILPYCMRPNVFCGLVWRLTGARLCIWNQRDEGRSERISRRVQRWAVRQIPWLISNSQHGQDFLIQTLEVKPNKIQVIGNGVELAPPKADRTTWRSQLGVSEDCLLACMVANLHQYKDHATLLRAWRLVVDRLATCNRRAVLLLAGGFQNTYESLQVLVQELELDQNIRFLGRVNDVTGLLEAVDLGVFSSYNEGVPNGLLECMAAGLAVVGTDSPGICEAVGPDGYRFLASPKDAEALADRILELLLDPELRAEVGAMNRHRIDLAFGPQQMCEKTVALIARALAQ